MSDNDHKQLIALPVTHSLKPYPEYKDSSLPWIGSIPEHWNILKGKHLFQNMNRPVSSAAEVVTCFRDGMVTLRKNRRLRGFTESLKEIGYQGVHKGDLVVHVMDAFAGAIGVSDSDGKCTPVYQVLSPYSGVSPHYYAYLLREMARSQWILALSRGIRERSTDFRYEVFATQYFPLPPLEEQRAIVRYLDHMDRLIRRYISARKKLIQRLNEQKQAIIQQAVTRGLNPNVKFKTSGVEWLGEIPEHWNTIRLGQIAELLQTGPFGSQLHSSEYITGGIPIINPSHMAGGLVIPDYDNSVTKEKWESLRKHVVEVGDVVFARRGELGRCALITEKEQGWLCGTGSIKIHLKKDLISGEYLILAASLKKVGDFLMLESIGSTMDNINPARLSRLVLPLPPMNEQEKIITYINFAVDKINRSVDNTYHEIVLMEEYKKNLITNAVTGKLDVREMVSSLQNEFTEMEMLEEIAEDEEPEVLEAEAAGEGIEADEN